MREVILVQLGAWLRQFELEKIFAPKYKTAVTWVLCCAPPGATREQLELATMDLCLWFLYLDDIVGDDYAVVYAKLNGLVEGDLPSTGHDEFSRVTRLFAAHMERLGQLAVPLHRYHAERVRALRAYGLRNEATRGDWCPTIDEYLAVRDVTILFRVWYSLWEVLCDKLLGPASYAQSAFAKAIAAATRWQVLINDLYSVDRDQKTNMPNMLGCLQRERQMNRQEATGWIEAEMLQLERTIELERGSVDHLSLPLDMVWAFDFLIHNISGSRNLYAKALPRYRRRALVHN